MQVSPKQTTEQRVVAEMRAIRKQKKMTQQELSERLAKLDITLDATAITRIELGRRSLKLDEAFAIATALDRNLDDILRDVGDPAARLRSMRRRADDAMGKARLHAWLFADLIREIRQQITAAPHLMTVSAEDYIQWVLNRMMAPDSEDGDEGNGPVLIYEPDHDRAEDLRELLAHLLDIIQVVETEPPEYDFDDDEEDTDGEHQEAS